MRYNERHGHWPLMKPKPSSSEIMDHRPMEKGNQDEEELKVRKEELKVSTKVQRVDSS